MGGRIEQQIQSIGQRLGENIAQGLIEPFANNKADQPLTSYRFIAEKISEIDITHNEKIEKLVASAVFESLDAISRQVKIKEWQQLLDESKNEA